MTNPTFSTYFYCPQKNKHFLLCNKFSEDNYLVRCSETGLYHQIGHRELYYLLPVERTVDIYIDKQEEVLAYLEDREQLRINNLLRNFYEAD